MYFLLHNPRITPADTTAIRASLVYTIYIDKSTQFFFLFVYLLKSLPLSQIEPSVCVTSHGRRPLPRLLIDSIWAQTALVSYLRPALSECHLLFRRRSRCSQEWLLSDWGVLLLDVIMNTVVVIYSRHLSGWRGLFGFEGKAPSIYLNASMFARIIHDPSSPTEEISTRFFKWIFANRLS